MAAGPGRTCCHLAFRSPAVSEVKSEILFPSVFEWSVYKLINGVCQSSDIWSRHILLIFVQWFEILGRPPSLPFANMNSGSGWIKAQTTIILNMGLRNSYASYSVLDMGLWPSLSVNTSLLKYSSEYLDFNWSHCFAKWVNLVDPRPQPSPFLCISMLTVENMTVPLPVRWMVPLLNSHVATIGVMTHCVKSLPRSLLSSFSRLRWAFISVPAIGHMLFQPWKNERVLIQQCTYIWEGVVL